MNILLTGGTGFIGSALSECLVARGHQLTVLTRQAKTDTQAVRFIQDLTHFEHLNEFDAVINLAGEPIFDRRWSTPQKTELRRSRLAITAKLAELCQNSDTPPSVFLSGSATGYYGNLPIAENGDEQTACADDFAARLCLDWEKSALSAKSDHTRVCLLRSGMVLGAQGGALKRMLPLYRLGLGGKLGNGKQQWAWISLSDQLRAILFLLETPQAEGVFNLVAPTPISNVEFNRTLAKCLNRPAFFSVPAFILKMALGERSHLLLDNQPLVPARLLALGFDFMHPRLSDFFRDYSGFTKPKCA